MTPLTRALLCSALVLPLTGAAQAPAEPPPTVTITLTSYQFTPSPIVLKAGQPVRLVFQNKAGKGHDFTARQFFTASKLTAGKVTDGRISLGAGESATVDLIPTKGTYQAHCGKFMHSTMGMKTQISVQ